VPGAAGGRDIAFTDCGQQTRPRPGQIVDRVRRDVRGQRIIKLNMRWRLFGDLIGYF
jgi:hypothetical protein